MNGHGHGHGHGRDRHGNPEDLDAYLARLEDPERLGWQRPDDVVRALALREGAIACDLGAGPGVFALRLARAVGPRGRVHAVDVEPRMVEILRARVKEAGAGNVNPILAPGGEAALPPEPCDVILVVDTFHHFPDGAAALRRLATALAPGGVVAVVDFHDGELPVGPPPDHRVSRAAFLEAAAAAGLAVVREETFLPYQYFVLLRPRQGSDSGSSTSSTR
jgi:ubiquinone/menaquinone biosynthesis C-methylase UbiE